MTSLPILLFPFRYYDVFWLPDIVPSARLVLAVLCREVPLPFHKSMKYIPVYTSRQWIIGSAHYLLQSAWNSGEQKDKNIQQAGFPDGHPL